MFLLAMGFTCLFYENKFMLISGGHIFSNRSIGGVHIAEHSSCFCKFYVYFEQRNMGSKRVKVRGRNESRKRNLENISKQAA